MDFCHLTWYLDAFCFAGDGRFDFAKASQLPAIIASEHQQLANEKQLLKKEIAECKTLQMHYCEVVTCDFSSGLILCKMSLWYRRKW